ncbi:Z1 domain-containing protein [Arthrobacter zhaoguopingii]|uniref:Z1 domain-containing protein n=1 Tax=Arthrobacter zhaoguopingii TaxID=2681491 RepID=UPI00135C9CF4|nr:Z1 domain-containing protein [Arthrobacter zhaoguopingii]
MSEMKFLLPLSSVEGAVLGLLTDPKTGESHVGLTEPQVEEAFDRVLSIMAVDATEEQLAQLRRRVMDRVGAYIPTGPGQGPVVKNHIPWLPGAKADIRWTRWRAYRTMLARAGRSGQMLDRLDKFTDDILDLAGDPKAAGPWNRRGLIIGDVQSGKTQNYLGLINKAADAGYRLVIILSGNTEYLRRQTHERVDEGFIGRDTARIDTPKGASLSKDVHIGVGQIDRSVANTISLTTVLMDYLQASKKASNMPLPSDSSAPVVFVLKKNKHVLNAVTGWARSQAERGRKIDLPLLLLDDESDYASINTAAEEDPTAINAAIRTILGSFSRSSYVAITATPFANIFIDHEASGVVESEGEAYDDLFPEDYIYPLEAPSNYVGIRATFGRSESDSDALMDVSDAQSWIPIKHKKTQSVSSLPESLRKAVRVFLLANAVMDLRVQPPKRRSMLVNVSRFTAVQDKVGELLGEELFRYKSAIELHSLAYAQGIGNAILDEFKRTFEDTYPGISEDWDAVLNQLHAAASDMRVKVYNSSVNSQGEDDAYEEQIPVRQIAVGGDLLSRGLTLEGLVVSYFHRSVGAADTMMQMARWFGYRDGFKDLCRLWISDKTAADYRFVADAIEELREDLAQMRRNDMTPRDFGLAVQQHPESLLITARNKSKHTIVSEKEVNLLGRNLETRRLSTSTEEQLNNLSALEKLLSAGLQSASPIDRTARGYNRLNRVPKDLVADFLAQFKAAGDDIFFTGSGLEKMIRASQGTKFLEWDIVLMNGKRSDNSSVLRDSSGLPLVLGDGTDENRVIKVERQLVLRATPGKGARKFPPSLWVSGARARVAGSDDLRRLMDEESQRAAVDAYLRTASGFVPESAFYRFLPRPQLMIYCLDPNPEARPGKDKSSGIRIEGSPTDRDAELVESLRDLEALLALKIALPSPSTPEERRSRNGRVKYVLNRVAQQYWLDDFEDLYIEDED